MADDQLAALEARIAEDPDDLDGWLVLADALQKRGDPHGELVALQIAADRDPPGKKSAARDAFKRAFAKRAPKLLGSLVKCGASAKDPYALPFQWRTGFLRKVALAESTESSKPRIGTVLAEVLASPAARHLDELAIKLTTATDLEAVLDALAERPPYGLRDFDLLAHTAAIELATVWKNFPRLRRIAIAANAIELDGLELLEARRVTFQALRFPAAAMRALVAAPWPAAERIELRVGSVLEGSATIQGLEQMLGRHDILENRIVAATFEDLVPLLRRTDLPVLTHLRIRNAPFAGAILRELSEQPLAGQLEVLDLSRGTLTPQDIKYAAERRSAFRKLRELWVPAMTQWTGVADAVASIATHVITRPPLDVFER